MAYAWMTQASIAKNHLGHGSPPRSASILETSHDDRSRHDPEHRPQPAEEHGAGADQAADLCRSPAALQYRLPCRRERPGLAGVRPSRQVSRGLGGARPGQPTAGRARPGLLSPVRDELQPQGPRQFCRHSRGRTLSGRSRGAARMAAAGRCAPLRQARAGGRSWSERSLGCLSSNAAWPRSGDSRGRTTARRHAAFRHSRLPAAARGSHEGDPPD